MPSSRSQWGELLVERSGVVRLSALGHLRRARSRFDPVPRWVYRPRISSGFQSDRDPGAIVASPLLTLRGDLSALYPDRIHGDATARTGYIRVGGYGTRSSGNLCPDEPDVLEGLARATGVIGACEVSPQCV